VAGHVVGAHVDVVLPQQRVAVALLALRDIAAEAEHAGRRPVGFGQPLADAKLVLDAQDQRLVGEFAELLLVEVGDAARPAVGHLPLPLGARVVAAEVQVREAPVALVDHLRIGEEAMVAVREVDAPADAGHEERIAARANVARPALLGKRVARQPQDVVVVVDRFRDVELEAVVEERVRTRRAEQAQRCGQRKTCKARLVIPRC
jgi:hypothetical protein